MTVGELIDKLSVFPKQVDVRFETDGSFKSLMQIEDIDMNIPVCPDEVLSVNILLREVGKMLPPGYV